MFTFPNSTLPALRRLRAVCVALLMVCSVTTGVLFTTTVDANADSHCGFGLCGDAGDDGNGPSGPPVGNPGDGPPPSNACESNCDDGGSGGLTTPGTFGYTGVVWQPANPPSPIGGGSHLTTKGIIWSADTKVFRYNAKCEDNYTWTDNTGRRRSEPWLGTRWSIFGNFRPAYLDPDDGSEIPDTYTTTSGGYECIEPPEYTVYVWQCVVYGTASYDGPYRNPVESATVTQLGRQKSRFALTGKDNPAYCAEPNNFKWNVSAADDNGKPKWPWGQYKLQAVNWLQDCNYVDYDTVNQRTGTYNANSIHCYGAPYKGSTGDDKLELFCQSPYFHKEFHDSEHTFTAADCNPPSGGTSASWSCGPVPTPVFNGRTSPNHRFDVLDDAKDRRLKWDRPSINGEVRNVRNRTVRLGLGHNVSPYRSGDVPNGDRQPFKVAPEVDKWKSGWQQAMPDTNDTETGWDLAFMAPGVPDKPWEVEPTWAFRAEFLTKTVSTVTIDPDTQTWRVTLQDYWYTADADCPGIPARLDVYRARNN